MSYADRGKDAEAMVKSFFERMNSRITQFAFERLPDARAARNPMKATICDFIVMNNGKLYMVEVKETESKSRVPYDNVKQLPRIRKWTRAGAEGIVLVYHSKLGQWRCVFTDELWDFKTEAGSSWDLADFNLYDTVQEAMCARLEGWNA